VLRRLRDQTRETTNLGVMDDGHVVVLTQVESRELTRAITRVGGRSPATASAMGKTILSTFTASDLDLYIARHGLVQLTDKTLETKGRLLDELEVTRQKGYAVDDEEFAIGLRCVAAPIYNEYAEPLCAISVSGLSSRMTTDRVAAIGALVVAAARELTATINGRGPDSLPP
jgi:IclR family transcriptional regulator, acetate operon repressor